MSIFRRDTKTQSPYDAVPATPAPKKAAAAPAAPRAATSETTYIAKGSQLTGRVTGNSELVVDGDLDGEIALQSKVVVSSDGVVRGEIRANSVEVSGKVIGNVSGSERVQVHASGALEGDVVAPRIIISEGAFFKGKVEMTDPTETQRGKSSAAGGQGTKKVGPGHAGKTTSAPAAGKRG